MNWMAFIAIIFGITAIGLAVWGDKQRLRKEDLAADNQWLQRRLKQQRRRNARLLKRIDEFVEAADLMNDCNGELERRNVWLEQRRYLILQRWWLRAGQRQRRLTTWRARKQ